MWIPALKVLTLTLTAMAMAFALAHAAEMPGKMRLAREDYFRTQTIYHPGFTIGGSCEPLAVLALATLIWASQTVGETLWPTATALLLVVAMQGIYWFAIHPINRVWLSSERLPRASAAFFGTEGAAEDATGRDNWIRLRDRWEYAHAVRAVLGLAALVLVAIALLPES